MVVVVVVFGLRALLILSSIPAALWVEEAVSNIQQLLKQEGA